MSNTWWFSRHLDDIWVSHLAKVKLHSPSSIIRSAINRAMTCLIFVEGGQIRRWHGCKVPTNLLWILYNENLIRQHFILPVTTLETWHDQYWHSTWFPLANDPCRIYYWYCPLTQHWMIKEFLPITLDWEGQSLWFRSLNQHLPQLRF